MDDINTTTNIDDLDLAIEEMLSLQTEVEEHSDDIVNDEINTDDEINTETNEEVTTEPETQEPDKIPVNSPTLLVDDITSRFSSAIWANKIREQTVILAGIGGIGSYVAYLLSRLRPNQIYLYDPDTVERANMSGQLFASNNMHCSKVSAISATMMNFSDYFNISAFPRRYSLGDFAAPIMMCGFDNMKARKLFYNNWKKYAQELKNEKDTALFIDGRLAAEEFQVFCIKGDDEYHMKQYEDNWLFTDEEAEETICSYKQTSHCANMIASIMINLFVNFVANQCDPIIERDVPFMISYDATTMYFKTIL